LVIAIFALGYGNTSKKLAENISKEINKIEDVLEFNNNFSDDKDKLVFEKFRSKFEERFLLYKNSQYYRFPFLEKFVALEEFLFLKFYDNSLSNGFFNHTFEELIEYSKNINFIDELRNSNELISKYKNFDSIVLKISNRKIVGIREQGAKNIIRGIEDSRKIPFEKVIFALGIRFVGETVAKKLAKHYKNIDTLMNVSIQDLITVDEIGDVIAKSVVDFFALEKNRDIIKKLKEAGLQFELLQKENETNKLSGKSFVVSGTFSLDRNELKKIIEDNGGKNSTSISKNTSYLIAGENMGPSKKDKAEKLGIKVITEEYFLNELL
jgi:DNA ligase (NAD+)